MLQIALLWLDLLWLPVVFIFLTKRYWLKATLLIISCIFTLRMQVELMESIGYPTGILPFLDIHALFRGYIVYGLFIFAFIALSIFSKYENGYVYLAASISLYFASFILSTGVLLL
ncbi:MAG: hypothetical protein AAF549_07345 [Pseudomonadota bacterium]